MSSISVNTITDASGGATTSINGFTPSVSNMAGRNLVVNGSMNVWQRGTSFPYSSFGGAGFCADRFWFYSYGGPTSGNVERSTDVPANEGFAYSLFNNTNSAMPSGTNVELTAQGMPAPFSVGKTYTLSFWVKGASEINTTVYINWRNAHADGANSTPAVATNPSYTIPTTWTRISLSFTLNAAPHANNRVLDFEYSHKAGMKITGVQLEEGSVATPFEHRQYGQELALCQRYYEYGYTSFYGSVASASSFNPDYIWTTQFKIEKRATPTIVRSNVNDLRGAYDQRVIYTSGFESGFEITDTGTPIGGAFFNFAASAEL